MLKRPSFSVNPSWPHILALATIIVGILAGLARILFIDQMDPIHCGALMNRGRWLDQAHRDWQPDGCMSHSYKPSDAAMCLKSRHLVFIGDSVTRKLYFQLANILDPALPTSPPDDDHKHSDHVLHTKAATQVSFYWDPFLNSSQLQRFSKSNDKPALLVIGSGLWYLRYSNTSGGLPAWEAKMEAVLDTLMQSKYQPADEVIVLPIEEVNPSKLSHERATSMRLSDIDAMNSDLSHRIQPGQLLSSRLPSVRISLPLVFNKMLDTSQTEDGLHFSDSLIRSQANILLNLRCNDVLPKSFPMDKTCCKRYPLPSALQVILLVLLVVWGPYTWYIANRYKGLGGISSLHIGDGEMPALVFSMVIGLVFLADRTGFWLKEQKHFDPWVFAFLTFLSLATGLSSLKRADKDLGFMNRDQTDEWKGWMQIAILIYHYLGASKISGIYNPIRVLVAAYLFMTGYGHTTFYVRKADFGFLRVAQVLVRLNFLTLLLAYTMNTDYLSYYFSPLVSMWFLIIYGTMAIGSNLNDSTPFLLCKILVSALLVTWCLSEEWVLEGLFEILERSCNIHWSAREWSFRVGLDLWIVYFGMLVSLAVIKIREHRLTDHLHWPLAAKVSIITSGFIMLWFFAFELSQESKFTYNLWHPYISFLPITAFFILRNATSHLRSASSRVFSFIGRCSLETFILQYHFWLAADTKGILIVIPGDEWRLANFLITSIMFLYVSHSVAKATGDITAWICGTAPKSLPQTVPQTTSARNLSSINTSVGMRDGSAQNGAEQMVPLTSSADESFKADVGDSLPPEPDTPVRARRWVDRLADGPTPAQSNPLLKIFGLDEGWKLGVGTKVAMGMAFMWLLNVLWPSQ